MMTEREYINATDLAKIRCALAVLREFTGGEAKQRKTVLEATQRLHEVHDYLCSVVATVE